MPVITVNHSLIRHKLGLLRAETIAPKAFREVSRELTRLLTYEASADLPLEFTTAQSWSGPIQVEQLAGRSPTLVPILRAGLGMVEGVFDLLPTAQVSMVGLSRNHQTLAPEHYFDRLVDHLEERTALILDPMMATAGSMIATVDLLKQSGCTEIRAIVFVAAPEGVRALEGAHPDVRCWTAAIDSHLDQSGYIIPGLGDAGDRLFGTS